MVTSTETMAKVENKPEIEKLVGILQTFEVQELEDFLMFMQGIRFAKSLETDSTRSA